MQTRSSIKAGGSITVFLSLVFLILFSFILVMAEAARYSSANAYAKLAMFSAGESVLGGYYGPLYDDYGLYAIDLGFGNRKPDTGELEKELSKYLSLNDPVNELNSCTVTGVGNLFPDGDREFLRQIKANATTELAGEAVEFLLEKIGLLSDQEKKVAEYERVAEIEKEFVCIDEKKLELMKLIDGIDMTGMINGKSGFKIADSFVKKPMPGNTTSSMAQINHPKLRSAMAGHYIDLSQIVADAEYDAYEYSNLSYWIGEMLLQESSLLEEVCELETRLEELKKEEESEETASSEEIKEIKAQLEELMAEERDISEKRHKLEEEREFRKRDYTDRMMTLSGVLSDSLLACKAAVAVCKEAEKEQSHLAEILNNLEEGFADELLETMQEYAGLKKGSMGVDFPAMRKRLEEIMSFEEALIGMTVTSEVDDGEITGIKYSILSISYSGLSFDYSGYKQSDTTGDKIETGIISGISEVLLEFITKDGTKFSDAILETDLLPSRAEGEELSQNGNEGSSTLKELLKGAAQGIADKALVSIYAKEHFKSFRTFEAKGDTALAYELEYLICHSPSDRINLSSVAGRILLVRLATAGAYVFSNSDCRAAALEAATLLLGFTGVPFLVAAAKYLILTIWEFEQAVVETAAIIQGQRIPFLTGRTCISIGEIPLFSHEMVCSKASGIKEGTVSLAYDDYLLLFLVCTDKDKLCVRMQDLIQENIRYRYNENFLMANCITSFSFVSRSSYRPGYLSDADSLLKKEHRIWKTIWSEYSATY